MTPYAEKTKDEKTVWRVAYYVKGKRVRATFHTQSAAQKWANVYNGVGRREGRSFLDLWLSITPKEQHEVLDALSLMRAHRKGLKESSLTMVQAAAAQIAIAEEIQASLLLTDAVDRYIETKKGNKRKGSVSPGWFIVLDKCLHRAARELPEKTLPEFSAEEIEEWLDDQDWSPRTYNNYRDYLFSLFKWAVPKYVKVNPVADIQKYAKKFITAEVIVPDTATVTHVFRLFQKPRYRHLLPARDLCFGLALRSAEASKMVWESIRDHVLQVPNAIAKGGRGRNISRRPLLDGIFRSLLRQKGNRTGLILPRGWRRDLTKLFEEAGLGKPRNIMRKSGGSYHFHATGDEGLTKDMMSHTEDSRMFSESYKAIDYETLDKRAPISREDGLAYYRLWD